MCGIVGEDVALVAEPGVVDDEAEVELGELGGERVDRGWLGEVASSHAGVDTVACAKLGR